MRIVSWNCNGGFRKKFHLLSALDADIFAVQECEDPAVSKSPEYARFATGSLWVGESPHRGVGVFAKSGLALKMLGWDSRGLKWFLPARVGRGLILLAVWTKPPYVEEYAAYLDLHFDKMSKNTVIIGDTNSNPIFDKGKRGRTTQRRTHLDVVNRLSGIGVVSAYHRTTGDIQGEEALPTFYLHRNPEKPYHLDHCFAPAAKIKSYKVLSETPGERDHWLNYSDHIPLVLDLG